MPGTGFQNGIRSPKIIETKGANFTLTGDDSGKAFVLTAADLVASLPDTTTVTPGTRFRFILKASGLSAGTGFGVSPAATDKMMGNGFTSLDNKDAILSGATDREGDAIEVYSDGVDGWYMVDVLGTWAREA